MSNITETDLTITMKFYETKFFTLYPKPASHAKVLGEMFRFTRIWDSWDTPDCWDIFFKVYSDSVFLKYSGAFGCLTHERGEKRKGSRNCRLLASAGTYFGCCWGVRIDHPHYHIFLTITQYRKIGTELGYALRRAAVAIPATAYTNIRR